MEDIQLQEAIERYLTGDMSVEERTQFEAIRKATPEIDQMVIEHAMFLREMDIYVNRKNFSSLNKQVFNQLLDAGTWAPEAEQSTSSRVIQLWSKYKKVTAIAASVGGFIALFTSAMMLFFFPSINGNQILELSKAVEKIEQNQKNLIYDTTAANLSTLQPILNELNNSGYETMMIMVYAHPIVSFLRNFKRERKVPAVGVLGTWASVYNLLDEYKNIFGDKFVLVNSPSGPEEQTEIANFEQAYQDGKLPEYFNNLLSTGEFASTFKKDDSDLSPEEKAKREKQRENTGKILEKNIEKIAATYGDIKSKLNPIDSKELPNIVKNFVK
jgi:hypothetical protein